MTHTLTQPRTQINCLILVGFMILGNVLAWPAHLFHAGFAWLPLELPLMIGAFVLPLGYALILAILLPLSSTLLTGMPNAVPMLPIMMLGFATYVAVIRYVCCHKECNIYVALIAAQLIGRVITTFSTYLASVLLGLHFSGIWPYFGHLFIAFWPALFMQLVLIPPLVSRYTGR